MNKKYVIEKLDDMFLIPKERRDQFFIELKSFIDKTEEMITEVEKRSSFKVKNIKMKWCDDGVDEINTVEITMPNKEKVVIPVSIPTQPNNSITVMFENTCGADDDYGETWSKTFSSRGEALFWLEGNGYRKSRENYYTRYGGFHDETSATLPKTSY